jgi:hypothetical protein
VNETQVLPRREREREKRRYRKVHIRMWNDEKFKLLSRAQPNAQTLWCYLLTGPHTTIVPGLFQAGEAQLAERLEWHLTAFRRCFAEIADQGMAVAEWSAHLVWLPNGLEYGEPDNPNVAKGWGFSLDELPECHLRSVAINAIRAFLRPLEKGLLAAFEDGLRKGSGNGRVKQEQEQEQEQEKEQNVSARASRFVERYAEIYPLHRSGARYLVRPSLDFQHAIKLCRTWDDDARLEAIAVEFLTCDNAFAKSGSRTIGQFAALASWCDDQLTQKQRNTSGSDADRLRALLEERP